MGQVRPALAVGTVAAAIWAAAGTVSVASASDATLRIVAPAPWWVALVGLLAGLLVPGWRRAPITALPALLSLIPWLPIPLPAVALLWTGPLAWAPIVAALAAAQGSGVLGWFGRVTGAHHPVRAAWLAAALTLVMGGVTLWSLSPRLPGGDEPHYLVITQSLLHDGDLRIENNHTRRDYASYFGGTLRPDYINRGADGQIYSIHAPGVSVLVLPAFAAFGLIGAQLTILLCFALTAAVTWRTAWRVTGDAGSAWFAWAAICGSATALLLGVMIFPDGPAALGTAAAVWLLVELAMDTTRVRARDIALVSVALAALPWLHTRFAVIAGVAGLAIVIGLAASRGVSRGDRARRLAWFLTVPALSAAAWFASFSAIYGTWDPRAPYRGAESIRDWIWGAVAGLFADQQFGLLAFAPVLLAACVGVGRARGRAVRLVCAALVVMLVVYLVAVASYHMWWAGLPGLPARFLTAVLPLLAVPLAIAWQRATAAGRSMLLAVLAVTWLLSALVVGWDHGALGFNFRDGQAAWLEWLAPVVNLPRAWPSFFWTTQAAFLAHAGVWVAIWTLSAVVCGWAARGVAGRAHVVRVWSAVWLLLGLMVSAQAGWRLTGANGLDPARSQLAVHATTAPWQLGAFLIQRARFDTVMVAADQPPLSDRPSSVVMALGAVPAGRYAVRVQGDLDRPLGVTLRLGRSRDPLATGVLHPGADWTADIDLPAGAASFLVDVDRPEDAQRARAVLQPRSPALTTPSTPARLFARRGDDRVYFTDDGAFMEADGFWVRGGAATHVVWASGAAAAGRERSIALRNGGAANQVVVSVAGWSETVSLTPWEERAVTLPAADVLGAWRVTIHSAAGFVPADTSGGDDRRYLGVWIPY